MLEYERCLLWGVLCDVGGGLGGMNGVIFWYVLEIFQAMVFFSGFFFGDKNLILSSQ